MLLFKEDNLSLNNLNLTVVKVFYSLLILLAFTFSTKAQTVYKTPSGAKYHLASCRMVKNTSEAITISQAKQLGLEPCKICNAPSSYGSSTQSKTPQGQGISTQCKGKTKSGSRCLHMTRIGNGYCFQHQP